MLKKILGTLTVLSSLVWFAFFINGLDRNQVYYVFLFTGIINLLFVMLTKFWQESYEKNTGIKAVRIMCLFLNVFMFFFLYKIMKSEVDLDDSDDILLSIAMFLAIIAPLVYLYKIKSKNNFQ